MVSITTSLTIINGVNQLCYAFAALIVFDNSSKKVHFDLFKVFVLLCSLIGIHKQIAQPMDVPFLLGIALFANLTSISLFLWTVWTTYKKPLHVIYSKEQNDPDERLFTTGPFAILRHPFYTSYMLNYFAMVTNSTNISNLLILGLMSVVYVRAASAEEDRLMHSQCIEAYRVYRQTTFGLVSSGSA